MLPPQKNYTLEFLRFFATVGVIIYHSGLAPLHYFKDDATPLQSFLFSGWGFYRWCVPIFMMITGYLLLGRPELGYDKVKKYLIRIGVVLAIFGYVFALMASVFNHHAFSLGCLWEALLNLLCGKSWNHLWYLYTLLGIYLVMPPLHAFLHSSRNGTWILLGITFFFSSVLPTFGLECGIPFPMCSVYVGYALSGVLLGTSDLGRVPLLPVIATLFGSLIFSVWGDWAKFYKAQPLEVDFLSYGSASLFLQSCCLFVLAIRLGNRVDAFCTNWFVMRFNRCSFGIYIIHMLFINVAIRVLHFNLLQCGLWGVPAFAVVICLLSWLATEVMIRMPVLKKYL